MAGARVVIAAPMRLPSHASTSCPHHVTSGILPIHGCEGVFMAIDESGRWWRGESVDDLVEYLELYTAEGHPATDIRECVCGSCGGRVFGLRTDREEGCARRTCRACGTKSFLADSDEYWADAHPTTCRCPCEGVDFNVAVGFAFHTDGDVRWVTVGQRCVSCGVLGSSVDWKIDYSPTAHLLARV